MRRALPKVVLCVMLGAITTIAVAWWCAVRLAVGPNCLGMSNSSTLMPISAWSGQGHDHRDWRLDRYDAPGACAIWSRWFDRDYPAALMGYVPQREPQSLIPLWARMLGPSGEPSSGQEHFRVADGRGWPFVAMWSCRVFDGPRWNSTLRTQLRGGVEWKGTQSPLIPSSPTPRWDYFFGRVLPLRPAWPGLLADTVVYAAAWGMLLATAIPVRLVRGRLRCWCERCPHCGYPFGVSPVCTECGRLLPTRRALRLRKSDRATSSAPMPDAADRVSHAAAPSSVTTPAPRSDSDYSDQEAVAASSVRTQDG